MTNDKPISEQIDDVNKIIDDLVNIDVKLEGEDKALLLLNSIPRIYDHCKNAMLYAREKTISLEEVQSAVRANELQRKIEKKEPNNADGLFARGSLEKRDFPDKKKDLEMKEDGESNVLYSERYDSADALVIKQKQPKNEFWIQLPYGPNKDWWRMVEVESGGLNAHENDKEEGVET
ncbi:uncharacterized protein [Primulina eburnea]|uniref:uncharacterized protein n=1 Tax=Primulina eburnea TaxID=1245227 RepID=UPI003C6C5A39